MATTTEIQVSLPDLKTASIKLQKLAGDISANKLTFSFGKSKGATVEQMNSIIQKYNELGAALAAMVTETQKSVDATRESFKQADDNLASHWVESAIGAISNGG